MRATPPCALLLLIALLGVGFVGPAAATDPVRVTIDPSETRLDLGDKVPLTVTVRNHGTTATPPLVVHLDVTDPATSVSVDPEDWTSTLSKKVGVVPAGRTRSVGWTIQPVSAGSFAAYAVALSPGVPELAASDALAVSVADRPSLNPGGILAMAIVMPSGVGALLVLQLGLARRTLRRDPAPPAG